MKTTIERILHPMKPNTSLVCSCNDVEKQQFAEKWCVGVIHVGGKCSKDMKDCRRTVRCLLLTAELLLRFIVPCAFSGSPTF